MKQIPLFMMLAGVLALVSCRQENTKETLANEKIVIGDSAAIIVDTPATAPIKTLPDHKH